MVKQLFEWYATGNYSVLDVTRKVHEAGLVSRVLGGKVQRGLIAKMLNNPVYYGDFVWDGQIYHGKHEPIITRELFDRVQDVLDEKGKPRTGFRRHDWLFQGLLFCGHCGCAMVGDIKKAKYVYYHCTGYKGKCPEKYVREEEVARQFEAALKPLQMDRDTLVLVTEALKELHTQETTFHKEATGKLQKEYDVLHGRLEALYIDKLDKVITPEFFGDKAKEWNDKLTDLRAKLDKHGKGHCNYLAEGIELLELLQRTLETYRECETKRKRRILNLVLSNSLWMNAGQIPKYRQPFAALAVINGEIQNKTALSEDGKGGLEKWWRSLPSNNRNR